jgi:hypothetical protein
VEPQTLEPRRLVPGDGWKWGDDWPLDQRQRQPMPHFAEPEAEYLDRLELLVPGEWDRIGHAE